MIERYLRKDEHQIPRQTLKSLLKWLPDETKEKFAQNICRICNDPIKAGSNLLREFLDCKDYLFTPVVDRYRPVRRGLNSPVADEVCDCHDINSPHANKENLNFLGARDGYCCVITGCSTSRLKHKHHLPSTTGTIDNLEVAHIVRLWLFKYNPNKEAADGSSEEWDTLMRFFPGVCKFIERTDNALTNKMVMAQLLRIGFEAFSCAFRAVPDEPHTYDFIHLSGIGLACPFYGSRQIKFSNAKDPDDTASLPSPDLLDFHYRLAMIFRETSREPNCLMTGLYWDIEETL